jgi:hypothetical protein
MLELERLKLSTAVARSIRAGRWGEPEVREHARRREVVCVEAALAPAFDDVRRP